MSRSLGVSSLRILRAIQSEARFGLDIIRATEMPSGTVYPVLARLKKKGLVRARWEDQRAADRDGRPRRRYYEVTAAGEDVLHKETERVATLATELGISGARSGA